MKSLKAALLYAGLSLAMAPLAHATQPTDGHRHHQTSHGYPARHGYRHGYKGQRCQFPAHDRHAHFHRRGNHGWRPDPWYGHPGRGDALHDERHGKPAARYPAGYNGRY